MAEIKPITIGERIVVHLAQYTRVQDEFVVPPELGQSGIAHSLGITRAHAAIELRRAMDAGRVEVRTAHITGYPTRRKVYRLTTKGEGIARAVRDRALGRTVELVLPDGRVEALPGPAALDALRRHQIAEARAVLLMLTRRRIDVRGSAIRRSMPPPPPIARSPEIRARAAFTRMFVQPYGWHVAVVLGPPHAPPVRVAA